MKESGGHNREAPASVRERIMDLGRTKERIVPKLIGTEHNKELLSGRQHTMLYDMAVVYNAVIGQTEEGMSYIPVTGGLMKLWGITQEELHSIALSNMERYMPYSFCSMEEMLTEFRENGAEDMEVETAAQEASGREMYVLTNSQRTDGAAVMLSGRVMEAVAERVGGDYYILPSSVHETLIIPKTADLDVRELERMVREVNETQLSPEERLSDYVYEYDARERRILRAESAEERTAREEKKERPSLKGRLAEKREKAAGAEPAAHAGRKREHER